MTPRIPVRRATLIACLFFMMVAAFFFQPAPAPISYAQSPAPTFEFDLCPIRLPDGYAVRCGYLTVPEDRANPAGTQLRLAVAIFKSAAENPRPDPILYVQGNLGMDALGAVVPLIEGFYQPWLRARDLIVLDQRGSGFSDPPMNCPEVELLYYERIGLGLPPAADGQLARAAAERCLERLVTQFGLNLPSYNAVAAAADIADLRRALGYEQWNVYALSLGTRIGMELMRQDAAGIRSIVLDAVYPPHIDPAVEGLLPTYALLQHLFDSCAADPACAAAYPTLAADFDAVIAALNEAPVIIPVLHPLRNELVDFYLNGAVFAQHIAELAGQTGITAQVPHLISAARRADYVEFARIVSQNLILPLFFNEGALFAGDCYEVRAPAATPPAPVTAAALPSQIVQEALSAPPISIYPPQLCDFWSEGRAPADFFAPVTADVPALLLAGEYDALTPAVWAADAAAYLPQGYAFTVPLMGHGALKDPCPVALALAFFDEPTRAPDSSCLGEMGTLQFAAP